MMRPLPWPRTVDRGGRSSQCVEMARTRSTYGRGRARRAREWGCSEEVLARPGGGSRYEGCVVLAGGRSSEAIAATPGAGV